MTRIPPELFQEVENAMARYGTTRSTLVRAALRRYLDDLTEEDIRQDLADDARFSNDSEARRARRRLRQLREELG